MIPLPIYERSVACAGTTVRYLVSGAGPEVVLLLHGGLAGVSPYVLASDMWRPVMAQLDGLQVIAVDLPGSGGTVAASDAQFSFGGLAEFVVQFLDALGVSSAHVGGHGESSLVVTELVRDPVAHRRVRSALLLAPNGAAPLGDSVDNLTFASPLRPQWTEPAQRWAVERLAYTHERLSDEVLRQLESHIGAAAHRDAVARMAAPGAAARRAADLLAARSHFFGYYRDATPAVPTTLLLGKNDPFVSVDVLAMLLEVLARGSGFADGHVLNRCGHLLTMEAEAWVATRISRHVENASTPQSTPVAAR